MSDYSSNAYAREQRMTKAIAVRDCLVSAGLWADLELWPHPRDPSQVPTREQQKVRRDVERHAGVRRCSDTTWALIHQLLHQQQVDAAEQAAVDREVRW